MSQMAVFRKTVRDWRGPVIATGVTGVLLAWIHVWVYPQYGETLKDFQPPEFMKGIYGETGGLATPKGFLAQEFFLMAPIVFMVLGIVMGTSVTAGEERGGTMDLLLAQPVSRRRLLVEKSLAVVLMVSLATVVSAAGFVIGNAMVTFEVGNGLLVLSVVNMVPIVLLFTAMSVWAGVALPSRQAAVVVVVGLMLATWFVNMVGAMASWLEPWRKVSPFYWSDAGRMLMHGISVERMAGLLALTLVFLVVALWNFERRDIGAQGGAPRLLWMGARRVLGGAAR